jgi:hypothetical protein
MAKMNVKLIIAAPDKQSIEDFQATVVEAKLDTVRLKVPQDGKSEKSVIKLRLTDGSCADSIAMTIWEPEIIIKEGDIIKVTRAYKSLYNGNPQINISKEFTSNAGATIPAGVVSKVGTTNALDGAIKSVSAGFSFGGVKKEEKPATTAADVQIAYLKGLCDKLIILMVKNNIMSPAGFLAADEVETIKNALERLGKEGKI